MYPLSIEKILSRALADEYFRLAYYGLRTKDKSFNAIVILRSKRKNA